MRKLLLLAVVIFCMIPVSILAQTRKKTTGRRTTVMRKVAPVKLMSLPQATFEDANDQMRYQKTVAKYALKKHDRHFNSHTAEEMMINFCDAYQEAAYEWTGGAVEQMREKKFSMVAMPVFLKYLSSKGIQQPSTATEWIKTVRTSMNGITKPMKYLTENTQMDANQYAYEESSMNQLAVFLASRFVADTLPSDQSRNLFWQMMDSYSRFESCLEDAASSCSGGGSVMPMVAAQMSDNFSNEELAFLNAIAKVAEKDPSIKNNPILSKYPQGKLGHLFSSAVKIYKDWYNYGPDFRYDTAADDVNGAVNALSKLTTNTVMFIKKSGFTLEEQNYLMANLGQFVDAYPCSLKKIFGEE